MGLGTSVPQPSSKTVKLGLLVDQKSEPATAPPTATSEESKTVEPAQETASPRPTPEPQSHEAEDVESFESDRTSVVVVQNVVSYDIDIHRHHDIHYHSEPRKGRGTPAKIRIEVDQKPERDERCEGLMREHLKRVAGWETMFR